MNATEQIALLRRACEMAWDTSALGNELTYAEWSKKYHGTKCWETVVQACREALSATATPPDDDRLLDIAMAAGATKTDWSGSGSGYIVADAPEKIVAAIDAMRKGRDEALAKLAMAQEELKDIYAAKPEPEFFTEYRTDTFKFNVVRRIRPATSLYLVAQCASGDDAQRIADALNGGGK